jgi:hypothetical protein
MPAWSLLNEGAQVVSFAMYARGPRECQGRVQDSDNQHCEKTLNAKAAESPLAARIARVRVLDFLEIGFA